MFSFYNFISLRIPCKLEFDISIWVKENIVLLSVRIPGAI